MKTIKELREIADNMTEEEGREFKAHYRADHPIAAFIISILVLITLPFILLVRWINS